VEDVSTCPKCGYSPVSLIPYFPDVWVCSKCNYGIADRLSDSDRENPVQRNVVEGRMEAVRATIEHCVEVQRNSNDPEEVADATTIAGLFESLACYLRDVLDYPDVMEQRIRNFHASLPKWHKAYEITRERIAARRLASKTVAPGPEPIIEDLPAGPEEPERPMRFEDDSRSPQERAADEAWRTLGPDASYPDVCDHIDKTSGVPCQYGKSKKWLAEWRKPHNGSNDALDQFLRRRKRKVFPVQ
jgi:hypothetical protein